jgi:hypothetical protein
MKDTKKKTAAIAAVAHYIKTQEEARASIQAQSLESLESLELPKASIAPPSSLNVWGLGGRQQQMQLRTMMQLKSFHDSKRA